MHEADLSEDACRTLWNVRTLPLLHRCSAHSLATLAAEQSLEVQPVLGRIGLERRRLRSREDQLVAGAIDREGAEGVQHR